MSKKKKVNRKRRRGSRGGAHLTAAKREGRAVGGDDMHPQRRPTLSACMIVKDEERFLGRCLESIRNAVDEIIVVDTGSTDRTVEIARRYGAKVYFHAWNNSFSEARNYSIQYATGDWILQIDADETLEQADIPLLHRAIQSNLYNAIYVAIHNAIPDGVSKHYFERVFRRGKAHYEGIVHNQLIVEGAKASSEIRLYHIGYNLDEEQMRRKRERTIALLRKQIEEDPENIFARANLIRAYRGQKAYEKVIVEGEAALALHSSRETFANRQTILGDMVYCHMKLGHLEQAEALARTGLEEYPDNMDIRMFLGAVYIQMEQYYLAIEQFQQFLAIKRREQEKPTFTLLSMDTYGAEDKACNGIGECYSLLGQPEEAVRWYRRAIEHRGDTVLYYVHLGETLTASGQPIDAERAYREAIERGCANYLIYYKLGQLLQNQGRVEEAVEAWQKALELDKDHAHEEIRGALVQGLLSMGDATRAERVWQDLLEHHPNHVGALYGLAELTFGGSCAERAVDYVHRIVALDVPNREVYGDLANMCIVNDRYLEAIACLEKYMEEHEQDARAMTNLALCYAKLHHYSSAVLGLQAALQMDPTYEAARRNLGVLHALMADRAGVIAEGTSIA